jgi:hypothetical protein
MRSAFLLSCVIRTCDYFFFNDLFVIIGPGMIALVWRLFRFDAKLRRKYWEASVKCHDGNL